MNKNKFILLIKNKCNDYSSYLMSIVATKIKNINKCELVEIDNEQYNNEYGKYEIPTILLIRDNQVVDVFSGFKYFHKIPNF